MPVTTHLKSLQALEMALRHGSLKGASAALGITPAAVGQRIRALEEYLGTDLLVRGRSGLQPTPELDHALSDLRSAFAALERVTDTLDFQRVTEIHVVADMDWTALWLLPRLRAYRAEHPGVRFCVNGEGDVPLRLGAPDIRIEYADSPGGTPLFRDLLLPVASPQNVTRTGDWDPDRRLEGMPLLHTEGQRDDPARPGWPAWIARFGDRREGADRGVHYRSAVAAMEAVRQDVGFMIAGFALAAPDIAAGRMVPVYPLSRHLPAPHAYTLTVRREAESRAQIRRFVAWLLAEAALTQEMLARCVAGEGPPLPPQPAAAWSSRTVAP